MTSTAIKRRDLDQTQGGGGGGAVNGPSVYLKIGSFDPAFNREITVMYKGLYGVCLLNLFASLGDLGTSSDLLGYEFTVLLSTVWHSTRLSCPVHQSVGNKFNLRSP